MKVIKKRWSAMPERRMVTVTTVDYTAQTTRTHQYTLKNGKRVVMIDRNRLKRAAKGLLTAEAV